LLFFGLFILWGFGYGTFGKFLYTQVDGTIVSKRQIRLRRFPPSEHTWPGTEYHLRAPEGREIVYVAGPTDASLPRDIPVGTYVKKRRWSLSYERDGERVSGLYFLLSYGLWMSVGFACLVGSFFLRRRERQDT
jgi:hypothetical protein